MTFFHLGDDDEERLREEIENGPMGISSSMKEDIFRSEQYTSETFNVGLPPVEPEETWMGIQIRCPVELGRQILNELSTKYQFKPSYNFCTELNLEKEAILDYYPVSAKGTREEIAKNA